MRRLKGLLRLGVCTVFLICLMYGLPACEKKEAPEQAKEETQEMMKGSATKVPEVQEKVEEAEEQVEEMVEEAKEEGQEVIEEGKEEIGEMHEMMEGSGAKMQEAPGVMEKGSAPKVPEAPEVMEEGSGAKMEEMEGSQPKE